MGSAAEGSSLHARSLNIAKIATIGDATPTGASRKCDTGPKHSHGKRDADLDGSSRHTRHAANGTRCHDGRGI